MNYNRFGPGRQYPGGGGGGGGGISSITTTTTTVITRGAIGILDSGGADI